MGGVKRLSSPIFIGRLPELHELEAAYRGAAGGHPGTVLVSGEAGVGKSRLLATFSAALETSGATVLTGGCVELGHGSLPYAPIVEALRPLAYSSMHDRIQPDGATGEEVARLAQEFVGGRDQAVGGTGGGQGRAFEILLAVLSELAAEQPTVLVLEDLHWSDASTRDALRFLSANLSRQRLLILGSYRGDELDRRHPLRPFLAELGRGRRVQRINLERFGIEEVREQIAAIQSRDPAPDLVARVFERSEGNAFFAEELLAADPTGRSQTLTPNVRDILSTRLERVSHDGLHVVRAVAVAGRSVEEQLLLDVLGWSEDRLTHALRDALEHQVLIAGAPEDGRYAFRHALVQEAVYRDMLAGERRRLHSLIARALTLEPRLASAAGAAAAAERAHHWYEARQLPEALATSVEAAASAEKAYAYPEALNHWERALDLFGDVPGAAQLIPFDPAALAERAATVAGWCRDSRRAAALLRLALQRIDEDQEPARAGHLHAELVRELSALGDRAGAARESSRAFDLVPSEPPTRTRAILLFARAWSLIADGRYVEARAAAEEARAVARRAGLPREGNDPLIFAMAFSGAIEDAGSLASEALTVAQREGTPVEVAEAWRHVGHVLQADLRFDESVSALLEGATAARAAGLATSVGGELECYAAESMRRAGRWTEAEELSRALLDRAGPNALAVHQLRAFLLAPMGRLEEAERHAESAGALTGGQLSPWDDSRYYPALVEIAVWRGRLEEARRDARLGLELFHGHHDVRWIGEIAVRGLRVEAELAEYGRAIRSHEAIEMAQVNGRAFLERLEAVARDARASQSVFARESDAPVLLARAEWSRLEGAPDPELWKAAATAWCAIRQPYQAAYARYREAEALLRLGRARNRAASALRDALETATTLGAVPLANGIDELARRARVSIAPTRKPAPERPRGGAGGEDVLAVLTPRERQVLALVGAGDSDRRIGRELFISEKTASVHVANIKGKLGLDTRLEAATLAHRLGVAKTNSGLADTT